MRAEVTRQAVLKRPVWTYLVLAYGFSWLVWVPRVLLCRIGRSAFPVLAVTVGAYGPTLAALIVTAVIDGREGFVALLVGASGRWMSSGSR